LVDVGYNIKKVITPWESSLSQTAVVRLYQGSGICLKDIL
jgi:hypothetical protein